MRDTTKSFKITIFGDEYTLVSNEPESHILKSVHIVDTLMHDIAKKTSVPQEKKIAVLTALQLASKLLLLETEMAEGKMKENNLITLIDKALHAVS